MIQITPQLRILVAVEAIDGRKGMDSLAQLCREKLNSDPFSGCLFIFRNRSARAIRILARRSSISIAHCATAAASGAINSIKDGDAVFFSTPSAAIMSRLSLL